MKLLNKLLNQLGFPPEKGFPTKKIKKIIFFCDKVQRCDKVHREIDVSDKNFMGSWILLFLIGCVSKEKKNLQKRKMEKEDYLSN